MVSERRGAVAQGGNLAETVRLLDDVSKRSIPNQRALARQIGVSVGLVNALLHRAVHKGLIKIKEAPARRYGYYLTPKGFAEKSRLAAEYLDYSLSFFRAARQEYRDIFARCAAIGRGRIILCGVGELAEIAVLAASGLSVELLAIFDQQVNHVRICGLPIVRDLSAIDTDVILVVTEGRKPQELYNLLVGVVGADRVFAPSFLRISTKDYAVD